MEKPSQVTQSIAGSHSETERKSLAQKTREAAEYAILKALLEECEAIGHKPDSVGIGDETLRASTLLQVWCGVESYEAGSFIHFKKRTEVDSRNVEYNSWVFWVSGNVDTVISDFAGIQEFQEACNRACERARKLSVSASC